MKTDRNGVKLDWISAARIADGWNGLYEIFLRLHAEYQKTLEENDKLKRLLSGETVGMECKEPSASAIVKFFRGDHL